MTGKIKILLAEDDLQIIDMYRSKFEMEGFDVQFAEDGEQAIEILTKWKPDIALLDIMMPKVNGLDVLKFIKEKEGYEDVLTVMLTNLGNESTAEEIYKLGATEYIVKADMTPLEVSDKVKELIKYYDDKKKK
ncbi:MAG: response regulator [Patescibacteria group bacterium]|nr:response regulator [Patescibacteria group bacterium]